ncbi:hypothetical protein Vi05172_g2031 [Venturia inaequalis]|nr:hypothetical protein Vi05172_g2031 [Venturia inaequalis]
MLFAQMFQEMPHRAPYTHDPAGRPQIRSTQHMLALMNHLLTQPPAWSDWEDEVGVVGVPFQVLYDWPMGTASGYAVFQDPGVNDMLKRVLDVWGGFLAGEGSRVCLGTGREGWFGEVAKAELERVANEATPPSSSSSVSGERVNLKFEDLFYCDPTAEYHGYNSWDAFFTRSFRFSAGIRPTASPHDPSVIANTCESRPYKTCRNVHAHATFWAKGQPYSIHDILAHSPLSTHFVGGTVYQAFLSSLSYHRWHAPVSGRIVKVDRIAGTYFSEAPYTGFLAREGRGLDVEGQVTGQAYLAAMATRALIFIQADNVEVGLMCVVPIGMVEVSTCEVTVEEGDYVEKGDQLGMFHFGGSTHCLLFRRGVELEGFPEAGREVNVPVRGELCRVVKREAVGRDVEDEEDMVVVDLERV